jgi:hypothetical protein
MMLPLLRARFTGFVWRSHAVSRLFVGVVCLAAGLRSGSMTHALLLLSTTLLLLIVVGTPASTVWRALKILAFLVLPILVLHMWLTPGRVLLSFGRFGDISAEGLARGGWLSLHLVLMYFSAMLFSRLVSVPEWMVLSARFGGGRLQPYLMLMMPLARQVRWRTQLLARQWRQRGTWRELALALSAVLDQCMAVSRQQAEALWLRWPVVAGDARSFLAAGTKRTVWPATLLMMLIGAGLFAAAMGGR